MWTCLGTQPREAAATRRSFDGAALAALVQRSRRWKIPEELVRAAPVAPPTLDLLENTVLPTAAWKPTGHAISFFASMFLHLAGLFSAAFIAGKEQTVREPVLSITAGPATWNELPIAELEAISISTEPSPADAAESWADIQSIPVEPEEFFPAEPAIQLERLDETWRVALTSATGASLSEAAGTGPGAAGGQAAEPTNTPALDESASFFGVSAIGQKFVFVCDCSRSMAGEKWYALRRELERSINELSERQSFYIIFFDGEMHPMFAPDALERSLLPANPENLDKTRMWLSLVSLGPNTSPFESVKYALTLEPDAIFLLTDGEFSDYTAPYLREFHRKRRAQQAKDLAVHTIGFYDKKHQAVLRRIAHDSGGVYRFVEPPRR